MTTEDVLREVYESLMNKVFQCSANYLMTKPKRGLEKEFEHYSEMAEVIQSLIDREKETEDEK